ncbi:MAG: peroxiredoxin [Verrucomicrobiota bacterium]
MSVLVGKTAPFFSTSAVLNGHEIVNAFSLDQFRDKKYVVLFFYPKDFTFVCPTELHAFQEKLAEFEKRDAVVLGVSTDTAESHWAWLQMPKNQGGIQGVKYPLLADSNKTISAAYDVLNGEFGMDDDGNLTASSEMIAYRALFLIDKEGQVRHQLVNDLPLGRNVEEAIRILDALQFFEKNGEVCPANWSAGKAGMKADFAGVADYLSKH